MTYAIGELMTDDDSLAHYGVKGMRWGVRVNKNAHAEAVAKKKYSDAEIKTARKNQKIRAKAVTEAMRRSEKGSDGYLILNRETADAIDAWRDTGDDRYIANRATRGEKIVATLLLGPVGAYRLSDRRTGVRTAREQPYG